MNYRKLAIEINFIFESNTSCKDKNDINSLNVL